ncbi:MAG TPA: acyl-ACP desaturase [Bacteroidota bacterium]|nr:acyl-ACP desaturase [Bacteroidota bacterium]
MINSSSSEEKNKTHLLDSKFEVLSDMEAVVEDLMKKHEEKRELWFPSDFLPADETTNEDLYLKQVRERAKGIPLSARVALALNLITEEGLPHFHRLIAVHLGNDSFWKNWNFLWTAEEDRHGNVIRDYCRDSRIMNFTAVEKAQFQYVRSGFDPDWDKDPYRVFVYTSAQERATQISHDGTGRVCGTYEPTLQKILHSIAMDEARHYTFYRSVFGEVLKRDPDEALASAAVILPSIDMPGHSLRNFNEYADVVRRSGIYGPRDYISVVEALIKVWGLEALCQLKEKGKKAQEKILAIPDRLRKVAEYIESRSSSKTFQLEFVFNKVFQMG